MKKLLNDFQGKWYEMVFKVQENGNSLFSRQRAASDLGFRFNSIKIWDEHWVTSCLSSADTT